MNLVAHRGLWKNREDSNSLSALRRAITRGFSVETDIRSHSGRLYLSHDPIQDPKDLTLLEELLKCATKDYSGTLFLNVKEDGLVALLEPYYSLLTSIRSVFFDMSVPELVKYSKKFPASHLCTRVSDFEPVPSAEKLCDWVWADGFQRDLNKDELFNLRRLNKHLVFVSSEIHGRDEQKLLALLEEVGFLQSNLTFLCTDRVEALLQGRFFKKLEVA